MNKRGLLALLLRCLSLWSWSFLLLGWLVELVSYEDNTDVLNAIGILPFLRLEIAFYRNESSLYKAIEGRGVLVFAPCLYIHEG